MDTQEYGNRLSELIASLQEIPINWALTPVNGNKIPYLGGWQKNPVTRHSIAVDINNGKAQGFGIITGRLSSGIMAIDCDGHIPHALFKDILGGEIPQTIAFTSGMDGRAQYLFVVREDLWDDIKTKKVGNAKEEGLLEFRWNSCQSVLPPSVHPETGQYQWINSPDTTEIAPLPDRVLDYLLNPKVTTSSPPTKTKTKTNKASKDSVPPIPIERCLSKIHREALKNGVVEGSRDDMGCSLARDLIGVAAHVPLIEFEHRNKTYQLQVDGDPYQLLSEYCQTCTPPLSDRDCDRIYQSALNHNPSPSIQNEDALTNCLKAWVKENTGQQDRNSSKNITDANETTKDDKKTAGDRLLEIAQTDTEYFHTSDKVPYVDILIDGNRHTFSVRSKAFRLWLFGGYYKVAGKGVGSQTLQDTLSTLEAIALFEGETRQVHLRTAEYQGRIYIDLGTSDWKAIEIDSSGWRLVSNPPVRFWRPDSLLPLPYPVEGGSLNELKELLNVNEPAWILIITFLLFCFCPAKTYPILVISAPRGRGKTAVAEILKGLIDPGKAALIKLQGETLKLAVTLSRRWLAVYDNVGHISSDQSDDLCRVATNFGYSTRTLHTTDEETTFEFTRPQIITAIDALVTRDDLADRVLMVELTEITEDKRLPQAELNAKVEVSSPRILGALLTALSQTLAAIPTTKPKTLPRMADYALFGIASEKALELKDGEFMKTFNESREQSRQIVIESSPVGEAIVRLMQNCLIWKGTTSELLNELENHTDPATYRSRYFPKASNGLSRQLTRLTPDLGALGILISEKNIHGTKRLTLEKEIKVSPPSPPNQAKSSPSNDLEGGDRGGDKGGDKFAGGDKGGDNCEGGDKGGDKKTAIPTLEIISQQSIHGLGGDGGDKKPLFSSNSSIYRHSLKVGDRVEYIGANKALQVQYAGVLEIFEIKGDSYTCKKPSNSLTSWVELEDLQLAQVAQ